MIFACSGNGRARACALNELREGCSHFCAIGLWITCWMRSARDEDYEHRARDQQNRHRPERGEEWDVFVVQSTRREDRARRKRGRPAIFIVQVSEHDATD